MTKKAFVALILSALFAGTSGLFVKSMTTLSPAAIAWYRTAIPTIVLGLWVFRSGKQLFRGDNQTMFVASGINALRLYLYLVAFKYTSIGNAIILSYTWPIFVTIFSAIYLKEKIGRNQLALLGIAFIGLIVCYSDKTFTFEDKDMIGMLAAIATAFFYAITVVIFKKASSAYHRYEIIVFQNILGAIVFIPAMVGNFGEAAIIDIGIALAYASIIGIAVFGLFFYALTHLKASTVSGMMYLEVVSAILLGALVLGEELSTAMIIGGLLILAASFFMNRLRKRT